MSATVTVDVSSLAAGQTRALVAYGCKLLVCNADGRFYAIENRCPHAMARLDSAALRGSILECPVHGGRFDVRDGRPLGPPIRTRAVTFPVREDGRTIEIELGVPPAARENGG